ncbi:hypothetical protein FRC03_000440 [Tulasnella sp. 419]|nr:hypothetical protein FRC03_000440 [Tulasnella sp. 419]
MAPTETRNLPVTEEVMDPKRMRSPQGMVEAMVEAMGPRRPRNRQEAMGQGRPKNRRDMEEAMDQRLRSQLDMEEVMDPKRMKSPLGMEDMGRTEIPSPQDTAEDMDPEIQSLRVMVPRLVTFLAVDMDLGRQSHPVTVEDPRPTYLVEATEVTNPLARTITSMDHRKKSPRAMVLDMDRHVETMMTLTKALVAKMTTCLALEDMEAEDTVVEAIALAAAMMMTTAHLEGTVVAEETTPTALAVATEDIARRTKMTASASISRKIVNLLEDMVVAMEEAMEVVPLEGMVGIMTMMTTKDAIAKRRMMMTRTMTTNVDIAKRMMMKLLEQKDSISTRVAVMVEVMGEVMEIMKKFQAGTAGDVKMMTIEAKMQPNAPPLLSFLVFL